jgi:hypothetical protein
VEVPTFGGVLDELQAERSAALATLSPCVRLVVAFNFIHGKAVAQSPICQPAVKRQ